MIGVLRRPTSVFLLPACFTVEVILGGPLGMYRGVPVRYILFGVCAVILGLALLVRDRIARAHLPAMLSVTAFLLVNGLWIVVVPSLAGGRFNYALREARAFVALLLVVLTLAVVSRTDLHPLIRRLQKIVVIAAAMLAAGQVGIWLLGTFVGEMRWAIPLGLRFMYQGAENSLYVGPMPDGFYRVFWISSLWCLVALFWLPSAIAGRRARVLLGTVLLLDVLVTYSRGIWLGVIAGFFVAQLAQATGARFGRVMLRAATAVVIVVGAVVGALAATGELERGLARFTSTASVEDESIGARLDQAQYLIQLWSEHPVLGGGYGAYHARHQRAEEAPFSYEHMPYALLAKLGLIGVLANVAFLLFWATTAWRARAHAPTEVASLLGGAVAFLVSAMTNPMLINVVGMSIVGCFLLQWAAIYIAPPTPPPGIPGGRP